MSSVSNPRTVDLPPLYVRAAIAPSSINEENRTVDLTFSTGAAVRRFDWRNGEYYIEKLSMKPEHIRLERLNAGAPLLDAHSGWSVTSQLGVVEDGTAQVTGKKGIATVRFSRRPEVDPIWQDVMDRIIRNVSVGYDVHKYQETPAKDGGLPIRTAVDWEPYEISMVPMPADIQAQTRSTKPETHPCQIVMTRSQEPPATTPRQETPMEPETSDTLVEQNPLQPEPAAQRMTAADPPELTDADRAALVERSRVQGITNACRAGRMSSEFMDKLIADGVTLVDAQARVFDEMRKRGGDATETRGHVRDISVGDDPFIHERAGIENALCHRVAPSYFKLDDKGRKYRGQSLLDIAKVYVQNRLQVRTTGMTKLEVAGLALGLNYRTGMHTTSDFATLLANVASATLRRAYEEVPQTFQPIARRITLPDFKPTRRLALGDAPDLLKVLEHGEFKRGTIGEGSETMQLATYGRIFAITRQALVNDDVDAFSRVPTLFGRSARKLESDLVWEQITSNPTMGDTNALFSAAHGNLQTDGDVISVNSLSRARLAMRTQTNVDGSTVNVVPKYLVVPPSLETIAEQIIAPILNAQLSANINPFAGRLIVIVEPRLEANSSTAWYLVASPDQVDIIEYAYLEGEEGVSIENRVGFDIDGLEIKARLDFAAKAVDWRGIHKDPGEAVS